MFVKLLNVLLLWCVSAGILFAAEKTFIPDYKNLKLPNGIVKDGDLLKFNTNRRIEFKDPAVFTESGRIILDFQLNFDAADGELMKKNRPWRNQTLFTLERSDKVYAQGYITINGGKTSICYGVFQRGKPALFATSGKFQLEKGKRHRIEISYGDKVLIYVDGKQIVVRPKPLRGMFGEAAPEPVRLFILGASTSGSISNNCTIGNIKIESRNLSREKISMPKLPAPPQALTFEQVKKNLEQQGVEISGFCNANKMLDKNQPQISIGYTEDGFFFNAFIPAADGAPPRATEVKHDGAVWKDDSLELRLQTVKNGPVYVFICNAAGTKLDGVQAPDDIKSADWSINPFWQIFTKMGSNYWEAAGFIPFKSLNCPVMPPAGSLWKINFSVGRPSGSGITLTQPNASCYPDPDGFPELFFTGSVQALGIESITDFVAGRPRVAFHVANSRDPVVTVCTLLYDNAGREVDRWQFRLNDQLDAVYMPKELPEGKFTLVISAQNSKQQELLKRVVSFQTDLKSSLLVRNYPYSQYADVKLTVNSQLMKQKNVSAVLTLQQHDRQFAQKHFKLASNTHNVRFDTADLGPGKYAVTAELSASGQKKETVSGELQIFAKPDWFDNKIAIDNTVPEPWKKIENIPNGARVLLRDYLYNGNVMFQQIVNQKKNMLRKAPVFKLGLAGAEVIDLSSIKALTSKNYGDKVVRAGSTAVNGTRITLTGTLEFDGCTRYDLEIVPPPGGVTIRDLHYTFDLEPYWGNMVVAGSGTNHSVEKLTGNKSYSFRPYNFLGGDHGGIAVFAESEENWSLRNPRCINFNTSTNGSSMTLQIVGGKGIKLEQPFTYTLGMIATPVRQVCKKTDHLIQWARYHGEKLIFAENIVYPALPAIPQGFLELKLKAADRTSPGAVINLEVRGKNISLRNDNGVWSFLYGSKLMAKTAGKLSADEFKLLKLNWSKTGYSAELDGKKLFENILLPVPETVGSTLLLGGRNYWQRQERSSIQIDSLRLAAVKESAAQTVLQDEFDENFTPDGFSMVTAGGGMASAGAVFIKSGSGKALELKTRPPVSEAALRKQLGATHERVWRWHNDGPGIERQWPPNYFNPVLPSTFSRVKQAHKDGFKIIPYAIYPAIHYPSQLARQFGAEWKTVPVNMQPYAPPAGHHMYRVSLAAKGYADYLLAGLADAFEKYKFDGIYTDGMLNVFANSNAAANCGWSDKQGNRHPTWPFFAVRENIKRIYKFVKSKPGRIVENHQSFSIPAMLMGFSDKIFTGELEDFSDLESARMRFTSRPWGGNMLLHRTEDWRPLNVMTGLLTGTSLDGRGLGGKYDLARKYMRLLKAEKLFGTDEAVFLPFYTAEEKLIAGRPDKVRCAAWVKKDSILLIAGNYNNTSVTAEIKLAAQSPYFTGNLSEAYSGLTGAKFKTKGRTLYVPLLPHNFQMIIINFK